MSVLIFGSVAFLLLIFVLSKLGRDERISMPGAAAAPGSMDSVESLILAGRKIEAIKLVRERSRMGLKEAKEEVEALERTLRAGS